MSGGGQIGTLSGQVVHKRKVSKKLCFLDLLQQQSDDDVNEPSTKDRKTVILKSWISGVEVMFKALKGPDKIHAGDWVQFQGELGGDGEQEMIVKSFEILKRWSDQNPGAHFQPIPPENLAKKLKMASGDGGANDRVCKFWLNTGHCPKMCEQQDGGVAASLVGCCPYSHPEPSQELVDKRLQYIKSRLEKRKQLQLTSSSGHEGSDSDAGSNSNLASRHQRASIFADWILDKNRGLSSDFLLQLSNPDHVILDVAGGRKCEVGFELKIKRSHQVKSKVICIDPRASAGESKRPKWKSKIMKKRKKEVEKEEEHKDEDLSMELQHLEEVFDSDLLDKLLMLQKKNVRLILGMHPDEATEPIVDLALSKGISFAVVPCCVFAHSNPGRRLRSSGEEPKTYQQFCDYLMEKDPDIQKDSLGFRGRDKVIYRFIRDDL